MIKRRGQSEIEWKRARERQKLWWCVYVYVMNYDYEHMHKEEFRRDEKCIHIKRVLYLSNYLLKLETV